MPACACVSACASACAWARVRACLRACACVCVSACARMCACVCVSACVRACACLSVCARASARASARGCVQMGACHSSAAVSDDVNISGKPLLCCGAQPRNPRAPSVRSPHRQERVSRKPASPPASGEANKVEPRCFYRGVLPTAAGGGQLLSRKRDGSENALLRPAGFRGGKLNCCAAWLRSAVWCGGSTGSP